MNAQGTPTRKKNSWIKVIIQSKPILLRSSRYIEEWRSEGWRLKWIFWKEYWKSSILNPQNQHILLDNDLADLLEIKRRRSRTTINNLMSRHQNNQTVSEVKVNYISICNSNEISNAFNEFSSTIGPKIVREIPLTSDEGSIYLNNIPENCNKFSGFRPTTSVFSWLISIDCQKLKLQG